MKNEKAKFLVEEIPAETPIVFKEDLTPKDKLIHKGIFSPDYTHYYYTISSKDFKQFDIFYIKKENGSWSLPQKAFFNSNYNDHGMSFSPDGNTIYFSSTRPTNIENVTDTWHLWKSEKINGEWKNPAYIDIPNLRDKVVSHPIQTNTGTLYFHASNLDYSEMDIYHSKRNNSGTYGPAERVLISTKTTIEKTTPYVSPNEEYMIFAAINDPLELMITFNNGAGKWTQTRKLNSVINQLGQGNPFVTSDSKYLFYTTGDHQGENWKIKWVNIESEIKIK
ncbi:hypothetical protein [uncultured Kordia sp.]|uniref:hypothetical protein n=1 Tax=uncultured Kordia sp. TaxID=507699 RepID=UPI00261BF924|nr:hypothetical protein [uncultured Kordia sp.]